MFTRSLCTMLLLLSVSVRAEDKPAEKPYRDTFAVDEKNLVSTGKSKYFILEPGWEWVYEGKEAGKQMTLTITVLDETKKFGNVETRAVREHEVVGGKVVEDGKNYFCIDKTTGDAYYFGETTGGAWMHGEDGAKFGLMIPGTPKVGDKYYQEQAPKVAMDRAEVVSVTETVTVPAGKFENCLKTLETTPLEPGEGFKVYAPDVGQIKDGDLVLIKYTPAKKK